MKIVITGASGYIGSVLSKLSVERGHSVFGIDLVRPTHKYYDRFITSDIRDGGVSKMISEWDVDTIFHLAAHADVTHSTVDPCYYYNNNTGATAEFIYNNLSYDIKTPVIFSSTAAVYGESDNILNEGHNKNPINPYGSSKLMCEKILHDAFKCNDLVSASFRYFNVAGAYGDVGDHISSSHVIQRLCNSKINGVLFSIFGHDYNTSDGTCIRDYLHVIDVCRAHFYALDYIKENRGAHIFNLGTSKGTSVRQLSEMFDIHTVVEKKRPGDPAHLVADGLKFADATRFKYKHSDINNIIDSALGWYRKYYNENVNAH